MKTFQFLMTVAVILAATMIGGCSANMQMAQENATLKAKLAERERADAKLRSQLLAPGGAADPSLTAEADPAAPPTNAGGRQAKIVPVPPPSATPRSLIPSAVVPIHPAPAFQRAGTVGPGVGYLNRDPNDMAPCGGRCLEISNQSPYYLHVLIDNSEMIVFAGNGSPLIMHANVAKLGGGRQARTASFVPPGKSVKTTLDSPGSHEIVAVLYTTFPGQALQPIGVWEKTERFPYQSGGQSYPWGARMTVYSSSRDISTY